MVVSMTIKPIPDGYARVTPYLIVTDGGKAITFYEKFLARKNVCACLCPMAASVRRA